ncbi:bifunctional tryptophan synthase trp1 [Thoreauomyces humboldtii]|nr:bifunctional tryptophan synthase trp1 [Thoreauomyces humboldtii]
MTSRIIPSEEEISALVSSRAGNIIPVYSEISADLITPVSAYLRLAEHSDYSFLFESVAGGERISRYSFLGAAPYKVIRTGEFEDVKGDPLLVVENELDDVRYVPVPGLPEFTGGAIGYMAYDCVRYFEPRTDRPLRDPIAIPDSILMFCDTIVVFDHLHHILQVVSHFRVDNTDSQQQQIHAEYARVAVELEKVMALLTNEHIPVPPQPPIELDQSTESNVGQEKYEGFVKTLQHHITEGDIIQAVPSQRLKKKTTLHPFNAYRTLRSVNPSPYMFYVNVKDFQIVGASPEMLVKVENNTVYTHPIAGTRKRGKTPEEDEALAADLLADLKERSEHIMLVDLGRNDVNRICDPSTVKVDSLMHIERYSHVMHIVSNVSGTLRSDKTRFDAFRSIFPAGTVSGAPKVKAMELIYELEGEKRGIYAGAVGYFAYSGGMDTAIAIRTMLFKDGYVYLQAGAGIVYDSVPVTEWEETVSKLKSNVTTIKKAEEYYQNLQAKTQTQGSSEAKAAGVTRADPLTKPASARTPSTKLSSREIGSTKLPTDRESATDITLLIDNYDSFTWNVYQYLSEAGANVVVFRNDQVTLEQCIALNPRNVVISPGPGRPADAAISNDVIRHFAGKIPVLGVCLGEQCMFEIFGGTVTYAGEIVHGKTTPVLHDGKGLYEGVAQGIECTRYHSLVGDAKTLPASLEITSWIQNGLVMGVRHKEFVVEGVQYHPESIASEGGRKIFTNFLKWEGGRWDELKVRDDLVKCPTESGPSGSRKAATNGIPLSLVSKVNSTGAASGSRRDVPSTYPGNESQEKKLSILEKINEQRLRDVAEASSQPGRSLQHLQRSIALGLAPASIDFPARVLAAADPVAIMGEIKRASPSKGDIEITAHAATQAVEYARGGAAVISVLTEPTWFKGSLEDMRQVRAALDNVPNRPAVLRKDFVVDRYQIAEARLYGADTLLLIVAILTDDKLTDLLHYSRALGMEPMVEVANAAEMTRAVAVGSKVIGVNNRDLHTFTMDMGRTSQLSSMVPEGVILVALSGISSRADVGVYVKGGAKGVLVGEALMRSADKGAFIASLLGRPPREIGKAPSEGTMVKICGITNLEDAIAATEAGADFLGLIFAKSARNVTVQKARDIVVGLYKHLGLDTEEHQPPSLPIARPDVDPLNWLQTSMTTLRAPRRLPYIVGVFSNHTLQEVRDAVEEAHLDVVQFHGSEPAHLATYIPRPVIKVLHVGPSDTARSVLSSLVSPSTVGLGAFLLDTATAGIASSSEIVQHGGSGKTFDWNVVAVDVARKAPIWLAGGLGVENVATAVRAVRPACVDVCSGVEKSKGVKNIEKLKAFVRAVRDSSQA